MKAIAIAAALCIPRRSHGCVRQQCRHRPPHPIPCSSHGATGFMNNSPPYLYILLHGPGSRRAVLAATPCVDHARWSCILEIRESSLRRWHWHWHGMALHWHIYEKKPASWRYGIRNSRTTVGEGKSTRNGTLSTLQAEQNSFLRTQAAPRFRKPNNQKAQAASSRSLTPI